MNSSDTDQTVLMRTQLFQVLLIYKGMNEIGT